MPGLLVSRSRNIMRPLTPQMPRVPSPPMATSHSTIAARAPGVVPPAVPPGGLGPRPLTADPNSVAARQAHAARLAAAAGGVPADRTPLTADTNSVAARQAHAARLAAAGVPPTAIATPPLPNPAAAAQPTGQNDIGRMVAQLSMQDSPLMRGARTDGLKALASRGLLNSSMAVGAAQAEAYRAAVPIANTTATLRSSEQVSAADRLARVNMSDADRAANLLISRNDRVSRERMSDKDRAAQLQMDRQARVSRERTSALDRASSEKVSGWQIDENDRGKATDMITNVTNSYEASLANINANKNLSAADRTAQIAALNARRTAQENTIRALFDVNIDFGTTAATTTPTAPVAPAAPPVSAAVQHRRDIARENRGPGGVNDNPALRRRLRRELSA